MGKRAPRRGSLAFRPRARAPTLVPRISAWPQINKGLAGFAGYKVGCLSTTLIADRGTLKGSEVTQAATLIETPPLYIFGIRGYESTPNGLKTVCEVVVPGPKQLKRSTTPPKSAGKIEALNAMTQRVTKWHIIACTQPWKSGLGKKRPEVFEIALGGSAGEQLDYAKSIVGKEVRVSDVLKEGEFVDITAVTKGKGWGGVVKRFGVALQPRKATQRRRHGGSLGPETQATVAYTIPRAGQLGFHTRTESNKRILAILDKPIVPSSGWQHYGAPKSETLLIEGSIPGPTKRFLRIRKALRRRDIAIPKLTSLILPTKETIKIR